MFSRLQEMQYVESRIRVRTVDSVVRCSVITTVTVATTQPGATAREVSLLFACLLLALAWAY